MLNQNRTHNDWKKEVYKVMGIELVDEEVVEPVNKVDKKLKSKMEMYKNRYERLLSEKQKWISSMTNK